MIPELGHFCVILALVFSIVQILFKDLSPRCSAVIFILLLLGEGALLWSFISADFSIASVVKNTHSQTPALHRIFDSWNNIAGIFLLSVTAMAASLWRIKSQISINITRISALIMAASIGFLLIQYNPFLRLSLTALEGEYTNTGLKAPIAPLLIISVFFLLRIFYLDKQGKYNE